MTREFAGRTAKRKTCLANGPVKPSNSPSRAEASSASAALHAALFGIGPAFLRAVAAVALTENFVAPGDTVA